MDPERDRRPGADPALARPRRWPRPPRSLRATRAGWCFVAIVLGVGFAALNTGNNLLYLVLALMLAFLVLSGLLSEASLRGLRVERRLPREVFARSPNRVVLRISNDQRRVASFAVSLEDRLVGDAGPEPVGRCFALRVGPGEHADRSYVFEPSRRGDARFDGVRISTRFPFGLFVKSLELPLEEPVLILPAVHPVRIEPEAATRGEEPESRAEQRPRGDEVTGLREYAPGDTLRRVHWRRSLRSGRLLVGERAGEASGELVVGLRLTPGWPERVVEERVAQAASEVVGGLEAGLRVGLTTPEQQLPLGAGAGHRRALLAHLARVEPPPAGASGEPAPDRRAAAQGGDAR